MDCSICLHKMNKKDVLYELTCGHKFHYQCYFKYVFNEGNIFINCPLCREINLNDKKPFESGEDNLKMICNMMKSKRCCAINNTNGKRCKKKSKLLNYGFCALHHEDTLPKEKYEIMNTYIHYLLQTNNTWYTKIYLIDIVKKLLIKYPEIKSMEKIHYYMLRFKGHSLKDKRITAAKSMYDYYQLSEVPSRWINECIHNRIIY